MNDFKIYLRKVLVKANFFDKYIEKYWYVYFGHNWNEVKIAMLYMYIYRVSRRKEFTRIIIKSIDFFEKHQNDFVFMGNKSLLYIHPLWIKRLRRLTTPIIILNGDISFERSFNFFFIMLLLFLFFFLFLIFSRQFPWKCVSKYQIENNFYSIKCSKYVSPFYMQ